MAPAGDAEARTERAVLGELDAREAAGARPQVPERDAGRHGPRRPPDPRRDDRGARGVPVQPGARGDREDQPVQPRPHVHRQGRQPQRVRRARPDLHHRPGPPSRGRRRRRNRRHPLRLGVLPGHQDHLRVGFAVGAPGPRGRPGNLVPRGERRQGPGDGPLLVPSAGAGRRDDLPLRGDGVQRVREGRPGHVGQPVRGAGRLREQHGVPGPVRAEAGLGSGAVLRPGRHDRRRSGAEEPRLHVPRCRRDPGGEGEGARHGDAQGPPRRQGVRDARGDLSASRDRARARRAGQERAPSRRALRRHARHGREGERRRRRLLVRADRVRASARRDAQRGVEARGRGGLRRRREDLPGAVPRDGGRHVGRHPDGDHGD